MSDIFERIGEYGIVPLVTLDDPNDAVPLARALVEGGIPIAEVTFRTAAGGESIKRMAKEVPEIIVGSGTVHTVDQAKETVDNGGKFVITPGFNAKVVEWCVNNNVPVCPGTVVPSDIEEAMNYGLKVVKFFPAEAYGGVNTIKNLAAPFSGIKFVPTGGVGLHNLRDYLDLPNVAAVGGSFVPPAKMVKEKDWEGIVKTCKEINNKVFDFTVGHVGINANTADNATKVTDRIAELFESDKRETPIAFFSGNFKVFDFTVGHVGINANTADNATKVTDRIAELFESDKRETPIAFFSGNLVEVMKVPFVGTHGHICVDTCDLKRAMAMLERKGVEFDEENRFFDAKGNLVTAYMKEEIGGFAFHIRQRPKAK